MTSYKEYQSPGAYFGIYRKSKPKRKNPMVSKRDTQRAKVYAAERGLHSLPQKKFKEQSDVEAYVHEVMASPFFRKHWPEKRQVKFERCTGRYSFGNHWGKAGIKLGIHSKQRDQATIMHEIAHGLTPKEEAWHGPEFCLIYLRLVNEFMGAEAYQKLARSFREHRVKVDWVAVFLKQTVPVTVREREPAPQLADE